MSTPTKTPNPTVKLDCVRLSFPRLWTPRAAENAGQKSKYEASFILDKKANAKSIEAMRAAINTVWEASKDGAFKKKKPAHVCLREGSDNEHLDGYSAANMFVGARNHKRPAVVNRDRSPLTEEDGKPYAGCYVNATIEVYPFVHPKSGNLICASLRAIQFVKDGEPFGEKPVDVDQEFEDLPDEDGNADAPATGKGSSLV